MTGKDAPFMPHNYRRIMKMFSFFLLRFLAFYFGELSKEIVEIEWTASLLPSINNKLANNGFVVVCPPSSVVT